MGQKCQHLAQNDQTFIFLTKFGLFGPKVLILVGGSKSFDTNISEKPPRHLVRIVLCSTMGPNRPKMPIFGQKSQFWAKFGRFWANIISLVFFASKRTFHFYAPEAILAKSLTQVEVSDTLKPSHRWTNGPWPLKTIETNSWKTPTPSKNHWNQWYGGLEII